MEVISLRASTERNLYAGSAQTIAGFKRTSRSNDACLSSRYSISDEVLGKGGFSQVVKGYAKDSGEVVAVKTVDTNMLSDDELQLLSMELKVMRAISHPSIVAHMGCFREGSQMFIVQELMEGGDLQQQINKVGHFQENLARKYVMEIAEALYYLHRHRVAHRDVKLENILLSRRDHGHQASAKLSDFGFAKKMEDRNTFFRTMCGTMSYMAPEILQGGAYDLKVDNWSLGVVMYSLLVGYMPFRGEAQSTAGTGTILALEKEILESSVSFDSEYWDDTTPQARTLISSMLRKDPKERLSSSQILQHSWFSMEISNVELHKHQVFFMIGSQRSGSNWLRTMLDEREDLFGPHPPHIMRDFMPIIEKFGELNDKANFKILVDHVCAFVEKNQVPWTGVHGEKIRFSRRQVYAAAVSSCNRIRSKRDTETLDKGMILLSVFDAIMDTAMNLNGKHTWICKSMGMSNFHDLLYEFYGESRLRYIYLVRDPRDVAMSFMKTPVGDCHYYAIASKWTKLQNKAIKIAKTHPELVHQVHYETMLKDKTNTIEKVYEYIGQRRLGGIRRQASVLCIKGLSECISNSRNGRQSNLAAGLSYQFQNLTRGDSFLPQQFQKWKHPETGLNSDDILLIESVAYEAMKELGYETHVVGPDVEPMSFSRSDLERFAAENEKAIQEMNDTLKVENPGDFERRRLQAEILKLPPLRLGNWSEEIESPNDFRISDDVLDKSFKIEEIDYKDLAGGRRIQWSVASQQGYYPDDKNKPNQDVACDKILKDASGKLIHCFSVFDGHGPAGHQCAEFAAKTLYPTFKKQIAHPVELALERAHVATHKALIKNQLIDSTRSGTTATSVIFQPDNTMVISNLGDSSCIIGKRRTTRSEGKTVTRPHNLFQEDEMKRVKRFTDMVMTLEEKENLTESTTSSSLSAPRIWHEDPEKSPGVAFTRSIGDELAHDLGVIARPDVDEVYFEGGDHFIILCSDGVTEWLTEQQCIDLVRMHDNPQEASEALVKEARKKWQEETDYIDDITAIVIFVEDHQDRLTTSFGTQMSGSPIQTKRRFGRFSLNKLRHRLRTWKKKSPKTLSQF